MVPPPASNMLGPPRQTTFIRKMKGCPFQSAADCPGLKIALSSDLHILPVDDNEINYGFDRNPPERNRYRPKTNYDPNNQQPFFNFLSGFNYSLTAKATRVES